MHTQEMLRTHPRAARMDTGVLSSCIDDCFDCAQTCTSCADACLGEEMVQNLLRCIRLNQDCADICDTTGRVLSRQVEPDWNLLRMQVDACAQACRSCGEECEQHAEMHEHCRVCMEACRRCEESCNALLSQLKSTAQA